MALANPFCQRARPRRAEERPASLCSSASTVRGPDGSRFVAGRPARRVPRSSASTVRPCRSVVRRWTRRWTWRGSGSSPARTACHGTRSVVCTGIPWSASGVSAPSLSPSTVRMGSGCLPAGSMTCIPVAGLPCSGKRVRSTSWVSISAASARCSTGTVVPEGSGTDCPMVMNGQALPATPARSCHTDSWPRVSGASIESLIDRLRGEPRPGGRIVQGGGRLFLGRADSYQGGEASHRALRRQDQLGTGTGERDGLGDPGDLPATVEINVVDQAVPVRVEKPYLRGQVHGGCHGRYPAQGHL